MKRDHAVVIRMDYPEVSDSFEWRFGLFRDSTLPALLKQQDQDFDIVIRCNGAHQDRLEALSPKISTFTHDGPTMHKTGLKHVKTGSRSIPPFKYTLDYEIQTRIDSDDIVTPDFTQKIRGLLEGEVEDTLIIFQHQKLDLRSGKVYNTGMRATKEHPGPFLTLYQPNGVKYFIYEFGHTKIGQRFKNIKYVDEGCCYLTIHGDNASSVIRDVDKEAK